MTHASRKTELRWVTVIIYAVVGGLCAYPAGELYWEKFTWLIAPDSDALGYLVAGVLLFGLIRWLKPKPGHWSQWQKYPPTALPLLAGYLIFAICEASKPVEFALLFWPALAVGFGVGLHWYLKAAAREIPVSEAKEPKDARVDPDSRVAALSRADILQWVKDQSPGRDRTRDFVGLAKTVEKLLGVVTTKRIGAIEPNLMETCVVIGPFGSGKSTMIEHLKCDAEKEPHKGKVIVAVTSCWGFESSEKAQEHILEAAVDRLDDLIDCSAIRRLPRAYAAALRDNKGLAAAVGNVVASFSDPVVTLKHLSSLLELTGRTLVVVVEDIDRGGSKFDMHQLLAVFHHLRQIPRVSFIVTMSAPPPIELGRVAECIHRFHGLRPAAGAAIIRKFSESIRSPQTVYPVDLAPPRSNESERIYIPQGVDWRQSAARLAATLRTLKVCLHAVQEEWPTLDGEVDLDEFIAFVILREAAPAAHAFMVEHASTLRSLGGLSMPAQHQAQDDRATQLRAQWSSLVADVEFDVRAAGELLAFLFSGTSRVFSIEKAPSSRGYQTMWTDSTYLERMQAGEAEPGGRDQPALRFLKAFKERPEPSEHGNLLQNEATLRRICTLSLEVDCLTTENRFRILSFLFEKEREKGAQATLHTELLSPVIEWIPRNGGDLEEIKSFLLEEIRRSIPGCLTLALDLAGMGVEHPGLTAGFGPLAADLIQQELRKLNGYTLAAASPDDSPSLHAQLFDRMGPAENWSFLAAPTLDAMVSHSKRMMGQLIDAFRSEDGALNRNRVQEFFSDRAMDFYRQVSQYRSPPGESWRLSTLRQTAVNDARAILEASDSVGGQAAQPDGD